MHPTTELPAFAKPKPGVDNDLRSCPQVDSDGGGLTGCYSEDTQSCLDTITAGRKALLRRRMSGSGRPQQRALLRPGWGAAVVMLDAGEPLAVSPARWRHRRWPGLGFRRR